VAKWSRVKPVNFNKRIIKSLKPFAMRTFYREGSVRTILAGPCRGLKYRIFPDFGLSYLYGGWEPDAQAVMIKKIKQGATVYDIGANYGMHTLLMARLVGASGHVYAFEPAPGIFSGLSENIERNRLGQVQCIPAAAWNHSGKINFFTGDHLGAGHCSEKDESMEAQSEIEAFSLDDFVFGKRQYPPGFIKIDVEGAEANVLLGGRKVINKYRPILLIDLHNPEQDVAVGEILVQHGYVAQRTAEQQPIRNMSSGWPDENGIWGQIVAVHKSIAFQR
jgi:FkbM family methyltransferase